MHQDVVFTLYYILVQFLLIWRCYVGSNIADVTFIIQQLSPICLCMTCQLHYWQLFLSFHIQKYILHTPDAKLGALIQGVTKIVGNVFIFVNQVGILNAQWKSKINFKVTCIPFDNIKTTFCIIGYYFLDFPIWLSPRGSN